MSLFSCSYAVPNPDVPLAVGTTLPIVGFTPDQLKDWIFRQLGSPIWDVELDVQHVLDSIQEALINVSLWRPKVKYGAVRLVSNKTMYLEGVNVGAQGIVDVNFVDSVPSPTEIFYGNLISPAPLIRTGLDEYDNFLRWRKTWQRVTSVMPDWMYDQYGKVLFIHNPIERYHAGIVAYDNFSSTQELPTFEAKWVRDFALARSRYMYGDILSKFSGAIPGPIKDLTFDSKKRDDGEKQMEALLATLKASQNLTPISLD